MECKQNYMKNVLMQKWKQWKTRHRPATEIGQGFIGIAGINTVRIPFSETNRLTKQDEGNR